MNPGTLATLRNLVPNRPLRHVESLRIAELQADRLLKMTGITEGPVPASIITEIPKIKLKRMHNFPVSGCTDWAKGTWVIVINGSESIARQRFTLAHEFKHILDYRYIDVAYPTTPVLSHRQRAEVVCDFFAGCLLVPRPWLKKAWCGGMQSLPDLARTFGVSQAAIQTRLLQTGLVDRAPRCDEPLNGFRFMRMSLPAQTFEEMKSGMYLQATNLENAL
jgi:hypothetical protein